MSEYHAEILHALKSKSAGTGLQVPCAAFALSGGLFLDYVSMRSLLCEFPVSETMASVDGTVQFGHLANLMEQTAFQLAFLVSNEPCTPVSLNTQCIRPMGVLHGPITIEAKLRNRTKSLVFVEVKATSGENRTVATASVTFTVGLIHRDN